MSDKNKKSKIVTWKPTPNDIIVDHDGKIFLIYFEKLFSPPTLKVYDRFIIKKGSYEKQLEVIVKYINFFMKFYDTENEMATAYLKIKFAMDKDKRFTPDNPDELIDLIYELLFTPSIVEKVNKMVEENYLDDIENGDNSYTIRSLIKYAEVLGYELDIFKKSVNNND